MVQNGFIKKHPPKSLRTRESLENRARWQRAIRQA
jgi:hypothetical protein